MNKKTRILFISTIIFSILLTGCYIDPFVIQRGSGNVIEESRQVSSFNKVELDGFGEIIITQGSKESLTIEAEDNLIPFITTNIKGNNLEIGYKRGINVTPTKTVRFYLDVKDIHSLSLNGGGSIRSDRLKADTLEVELNGGGDIEIDDLETDSLIVNFSGAGGFTASGYAKRQKIDFNGAGGYNAEDLLSQDVVITIDGVGKATLWAEKTLDMTINGAGIVSYYGEPKVVQHTSGVGNVNSLGRHK